MLDVVEDQQQPLAGKPFARSSTGDPLSPSRTPAADATSERTSSGSRSGASGAQNTPSGKPSDCIRHGLSASRVFPVPPGPVSDTSRAPGSDSIAATAASSGSRPRNGVAGTGRFERYSDFSGGNSPAPSWNTRSAPQSP